MAEGGKEQSCSLQGIQKGRGQRGRERVGEGERDRGHRDKKPLNGTFPSNHFSSQAPPPKPPIPQKQQGQVGTKP